jgi:hypothetical protein
MSDRVECECHIGDIGSPVCGKQAVCEIEGVFVCPECRVLVLKKYPDSRIVEETAVDWEDRLQSYFGRKSLMASLNSGRRSHSR